MSETQDESPEETKNAGLIGAITQAIGQMGKICKANFNKFDKYDFVSIDNFLDATSGVCASVGLAIVQNETSCEVIAKETRNGKSEWLLMRFEFTVHHVSGESLTGLVRSVAVPFTGAQAFGSAQSYALKQFLRSLFQISTGDKDDPDFAPVSRPGQAPEFLKPKQDPTPEPTPPQRISDQTKWCLMEAADDVQFGDGKAFKTVDSFYKWIELTTKTRVDDLPESRAAKILDFLSTYRVADDWTVYREQLQQVQS